MSTKPLDRLQLLRGNFSGAPNHRRDASRRGHRPRTTQGLLRHTFADPARSSGLQHLHHWQRRPTGSREEVLCAPPSSATLLFEASKNRRLVDSDLLARFVGAAISWLPAVPLPRFHLRGVFNSQEQYKTSSFLSQGAVDNLLFWRNFSGKSPENLQELSDLPSTALYTDASGTTGWGSVLESPHETTRSSAGWWVS